MAAHEIPRGEVARTQFRDLIRDRRAALRLSLKDFAARAEDPVTGEQVKAGWIHRLETGEPVTPPQLPELRALAVASECDLEVLQDAAGQEFHGVDPVRSTRGEVLAFVRRAERLTPEQRRQLALFLDAFAPEKPE
ncbi:helix-turn-helix domain-containing protein [Streptomyces longispororuber]|uniref:helix-turn-helix domain-containing protein n=1 Tax=Streptomyces longispororuber TaxID=68230 RepID=UPI003701C055